MSDSPADGRGRRCGAVSGAESEQGDGLFDVAVCDFCGAALDNQGECPELRWVRRVITDLANEEQA